MFTATELWEGEKNKDETLQCKLMQLTQKSKYWYHKKLVNRDVLSKHESWSIVLYFANLFSYVMQYLKCHKYERSWEIINTKYWILNTDTDSMDPLSQLHKYHHAPFTQIQT